MKHYRLSLVVAGAVVVFDQLSKWWVLQGNLPYVINSGGVLGLLSQAGWVVNVLVVAALVGVALLVVRQQGVQRLEAIILGMVLGAGVGNGIDRVVHGGVVDFLLLAGVRFNIADAVLNVAILGLVYDVVLRRRREKAKGTT